MKNKNVPYMYWYRTVVIRTKLVVCCPTLYILLLVFSWIAFALILLAIKYEMQVTEIKRLIAVWKKDEEKV